MSWGWRKLLQIQELVKPFFWSKLGNGMSTSLWYDRWCSQCPLIQYLSPRDITSEGYNLQTCVADLVSNNGWLWPQSWLLKAPNLGLVLVPCLDKLEWTCHNGVILMVGFRHFQLNAHGRRLDRGVRRFHGIV
ncbi:hypothetical protein Tco_1048515 [Tanacetum coccineum]